jgi:hypothetical protein
VIVGIPEPIGRKARLGPFPSGRDALKFASYAAVGAVVAGATVPLLWLPFLGVGLLASIVRWDGKGLDAHLTDYVRFRLRAQGPARRGRGPVAELPRGHLARMAGRYVAVLATGGVPIAFLPSREARGLFDGFRSLLRSHEGGLLLRVESVRVPARALLAPRAGAVRDAERAARSGYANMVRLLARHRRRRVVHVATWVDAEGPGSVARLEEKVQGLTGQLLALGLNPVRLQDRELAEAMAEFGWGGRDG